MDPRLMQRTRYLLGVGVGIKNALATRRIAREGDEVVARILEVALIRDQQGKQTSSRKLKLLWPPPDNIAVGPEDEAYRTRWSEPNDFDKGAALFADPHHGTVSVLYLRVSGPQVIVLREGFYPLSMTRAENIEAQRRADAQREMPVAS